jgi:ParB/RepB/Spo0J family partition protein
MTAQNFPIGMIDLNKIAAPSFVRQQNGHDKESLTQLSNSIQTHGLLQPIVVRPGGEDDKPAEWVVIAGRRRLAACKLAKLDAIPAIVIETDEARSYEMEIAENIQREQMTLADTARAVRTLMTIYNNQKRVCEILNKSPAWVSKHLSVTSSTCPTVVQEMLDGGVVTDLETLNLIKAIAETPASNPHAFSTLQRMVTLAAAGNMNRQVARDALAKLRAPEVQPVSITTTTEGSTTTTTTTPPQRSTLPYEGNKYIVEVPIACLEHVQTLRQQQEDNHASIKHMTDGQVFQWLVIEQSRILGLK